MKGILGKTLVCSLGYLGAVVACLAQWKGPNPWARIDWFAGTYLARLARSLYSIISSLGAFRSGTLRQEWWDLNSDPAGPRWVMVLMARSTWLSSSITTTGN